MSGSKVKVDSTTVNGSGSLSKVKVSMTTRMTRKHGRTQIASRKINKLIIHTHPAKFLGNNPHPADRIFNHRILARERSKCSILEQQG